MTLKRRTVFLEGLYAKQFDASLLFRRLEGSLFLSAFTLVCCSGVVVRQFILTLSGAWGVVCSFFEGSLFVVR